MPKDAKLGLVVGMIVVLLIALLFFRKEGTNELPAAPPAPVKAAQPKAAPKIVAPKIEPLPKVAPPPPPPVEEEAPELPPPAFDLAPPPPAPTTSRVTANRQRPEAEMFLALRQRDDFGWHALSVLAKGVTVA